MEAARLRLFGLLILGAATLFSAWAASRMAFSHDWAVVVAIILFATSIRLIIAGVVGVFRRLGRSALLSVMVWLGFSLAGWIAFLGQRNEEGGPIAVLIVFGFYLGLPTLLLSGLFSMVGVRREGRAIL